MSELDLEAIRKRVEAANRWPFPRREIIRSDVPALLAEVERLTKLLEKRDQGGGR